MSDILCEQRPLLCEDEDLLHSRTRSKVFRGRAKYKVKGAAAIFQRWPDHWSSAVKFWWIGLSMIVFLTFLVYNSIDAFAVLPTNQQGGQINIHSTIKNMPLPEHIYMHLFKNFNQEIDLNDYLPYVDELANKFPNYNYHLIVITNDTTEDKYLISEEENNENALNMLWSRNEINKIRKRNIFIEHVSFSKYMNESPLHGQWRELPTQFIQFLVRAISIWDKGGIAFNPSIITPLSPDSVYEEKLKNILKKYHRSSTTTFYERKSTKTRKDYKKKVNNIRDIIDALEHEDNESNQLDPVVAENQIALEQINRRKQRSSTILDNNFNFSISDQNAVIKHRPERDNHTNANSNFLQKTLANNTSTFKFLPMFIEYLFGKRPINGSSKKYSDDQMVTSVRKRKNVETVKVETGDEFSNENPKELFIDESEKIFKDKIKPIIRAPKSKYQSPLDEKHVTQYDYNIDNTNQLTLDLKGNILVSETPCHAFLGTVFSNAPHHTKNTLTDFIITELSMFCKGVLTACNGIDIILL